MEEKKTNEIKETKNASEEIRSDSSKIFDTLSTVNVQDKVKEKNGMVYLSWAWAWSELKKRYPNANYKVYERNTEYGPVPYFTDGKTLWVKVSVTIEGLEYLEMLPVLDYRNKPVLYDKVTSFDVNKTIKRCLTKAIALHGLGLYLYAGEDLPQAEMEKIQQKAEENLVNEKNKKINELKNMSNDEIMKKAKELMASKDTIFTSAVRTAMKKKKEEGEDVKRVSELGADVLRSLMLQMI